MQKERQNNAHELRDLCRARIADLVRVFKDNPAFECYLSNVEGEGEKATVCGIVISGRKDKLDEVTGMDAELMLPCGTPTKTGPWDGVTTEVNDRHVRSDLTGDPDMKRWRSGRRVGGARRPLEMSFKRRRHKWSGRLIVLADRR